MPAVYDKATMGKAIEDALSAAASTETDPVASRKKAAQSIADAVDVYVKNVISTATVAFQPGTVQGLTAVMGAPTPLTLGSASNGVIS